MRCSADVDLEALLNVGLMGRRIALIDETTGKRLCIFDSDKIVVEGKKIILPTITVLEVT